MKTKNFSWQQTIPLFLLAILVLFFILLLRKIKEGIPDWLEKSWPWILGGIALIILLAIIGRKGFAGMRFKAGKKWEPHWLFQVILALGIIVVFWWALDRYVIDPKARPATGNTGGATPQTPVYPTIPFGANFLLEKGTTYQYTVLPGDKAFAMGIRDTTSRVGITYGCNGTTWQGVLSKKEWKVVDGVESSCSGVYTVTPDKTVLINLHH